MNITLITLILVIIACTIAVLSVNYIKEKRRRKDKMSFKESMDLTNLPIVTFYTGKNKLNFILDTGSDTSYINARELEKLNYEKLPYEGKVLGLGEQSSCPFIKTSLYHDNMKFETLMQCIDLSGTFDAIKSDSGVNIHGILGSKFFAEYKYILDFNELIAYRK